MAIYTVYSPPATDTADALERAVFVRDGASVLAVVLPVVWLVINRLWLVLLIYLALAALVVGAGVAAGNEMAGALVSGLFSLWFGLEANAFKAWTYARKGWSITGVVEANGEEEAEIRHFTRIANAVGASGRPVETGGAGLVRPPASVIGLFPTAGGRA